MLVRAHEDHELLAFALLSFWFIMSSDGSDLSFSDVGSIVNEESDSEEDYGVVRLGANGMGYTERYSRMLHVTFVTFDMLFRCLETS